MTTNLEFTDSPRARADFQPPPPANLAALQEIAGLIQVPFAFSHSTAADLLDWPTPWAARVTGDIHVITQTSTGQIRGYGVVGHRGLESRVVTLRHGLPVTAPADTWVDLGECVGQGLPYGFEDVIGSGDQALNAGCTKEELRAVVENRVRPRGKRTLLPALVWMRRGSESMLETQWRLCCHRAGLPLPALNVRIYDAAGHFLFRPDLSWRPRRLAVECQGAEFHNNPEAVDADAGRFVLGKRNEWTFLEIRSAQIWDRQERNAALVALARELRFPEHRLDLAAAVPRFHSAEAAATLFENLERRRRRLQAKQR